MEILNSSIVVASVAQIVGAAGRKAGAAGVVRVGGEGLAGRRGGVEGRGTSAAGCAAFDANLP